MCRTAEQTWNFLRDSGSEVLVLAPASTADSLGSDVACAGEDVRLPSNIHTREKHMSRHDNTPHDPDWVMPVQEPEAQVADPPADGVAHRRFPRAAAVAPVFAALLVGAGAV